MKYFLFVFFSILFFNGFCQVSVRNDSLKIDSIENEKLLIELNSIIVLDSIPSFNIDSSMLKIISRIEKNGKSCYDEIDSVLFCYINLKKERNETIISVSLYNKVKYHYTDYFGFYKYKKIVCFFSGDFDYILFPKKGNEKYRRDLKVEESRMAIDDSFPEWVFKFSNSKVQILMEKLCK